VTDAWTIRRRSEFRVRVTEGELEISIREIPNVSNVSSHLDPHSVLLHWRTPGRALAMSTDSDYLCIDAG